MLNHEQNYDYILVVQTDEVIFWYERDEIAFFNDI